MASGGLIPKLIKFVRSGRIGFVQDKGQLFLGIITILFALYISIRTTFVLDDTVADNIALTFLPLLLVGIHIFLPIGLLLFIAITKSYKKHFILGLLATIFFGLFTISFLAWPLVTMVSMGSTVGSVLMVALAYGGFIYNLKYNKKKISQVFIQTIVILFIATFFSFFIDTLLSFSDQYQLVAQYTKDNLPNNVSIKAGPPLTVHFGVWRGTIMIILYSLLNLLKLKEQDKSPTLLINL